MGTPKEHRLTGATLIIRGTSIDIRVLVQAALRDAEPDAIIKSKRFECIARRLRDLAEGITDEWLPTVHLIVRELGRENWLWTESEKLVASAGRVVREVADAIQGLRVPAGRTNVARNEWKTIARVRFEHAVYFMQRAGELRDLDDSPQEHEYNATNKMIRKIGELLEYITGSLAACCDVPLHTVKLQAERLIPRKPVPTVPIPAISIPAVAVGSKLQIAPDSKPRVAVSSELHIAPDSKPRGRKRDKCVIL